MTSAPTDCRVPDPTDAQAADQFVNRRAGYGDGRLQRITHAARQGWTLAAGEGLVLVQEIDRLRKEFDIATSMLGEQVPLLNRMQDENDRLRAILAALRDTPCVATRCSAAVAVAAAEQEASRSPLMNRERDTPTTPPHA